MSQETHEAGRDRHRGPETLHDLIMVNRRDAYGKDKEVVYKTGKYCHISLYS